MDGTILGESMMIRSFFCVWKVGLNEVNVYMRSRTVGWTEGVSREGWLGRLCRSLYIRLHIEPLYIANNVENFI